QNIKFNQTKHENVVNKIIEVQNISNLSEHEKFEFIEEYYEMIDSSSHYQNLILKLALNKSSENVTEILLSRLFARLNITNENNKFSFIQQMNKLLELEPNCREKLQKSIYIKILDGILLKKDEFQNKITSTTELLQFISVINSIGIIFSSHDFLETIETYPVLYNKIIDPKQKKIDRSAVIEQINEIILPYFDKKQLAKSKLFTDDTITSIKSSHESIRQMDLIEKSINNRGRHDRDYKLAIMIKNTKNYECESCGSKKSSETIITVSHMIPLYFGVEFGGVDKSYNMEVLCLFCHKNYERKFDEELATNTRIHTKDDLFQYLKQKFPKNEFLMHRTNYTPIIPTERSSITTNIPTPEESISEQIKIYLKKLIYQLKFSNQYKLNTQKLSNDQIIELKDKLEFLLDNKDTTMEISLMKAIIYLSYSLELFSITEFYIDQILSIENDFDIIMFKAKCLFKKKQYNEVLNLTNKILKHRNKHYEAFYLQAETHLILKDLENARKNWKATLKFAPANWDKRKQVSDKLTKSREEKKKKNLKKKTKSIQTGSLSIKCFNCNNTFITQSNFNKHNDNCQRTDRYKIHSES
ncbi:MAG: HNH endonuclease, partial [Candidatus Heimdallarchaeota archaeon]|nr:HNH endonuclease [Candidatus Heimdallarchaeota archaeon]